MRSYDHYLTARAGSRVSRLHQYPYHGSYTNGQHQDNVALLGLYLFPDDFDRLARYLLTHDSPEVAFGDLPSPRLRAYPEAKKGIEASERSWADWHNLPSHHSLEAADQTKIKICDWLEFYIWCREQVEIGNKFVEEPMKNIARYMNEVMNDWPGHVQAFWMTLQSRSVIPQRLTPQPGEYK